MTFKEKKDYLQGWIDSIANSYREPNGEIAYYNFSFLQGLCFGLKATCTEEKQIKELYEMYNKFYNKENNKNDRL